MLFAWDERNIDHIGRHGVTPEEAEHIVRKARPPWPQQIGDEKFVVWGGTKSGTLLQVIFVLRQSDELEFDSLTINEWADLERDHQVVYVIHAMELTDAMKRQYRKRKKRS